MKRIFLILITLMLFGAVNQLKAQTTSKLVDLCAAKAGSDATYIKDYIVELQGAAPGEKQTPFKTSFAMQKNTIYRISVCNAESSNGHAIVELYDMNRLIGTNYNSATGQEFKKFEFQCNKAGVYHLFVHFADNKPGNAVCIISFIGKM